VHDAVPELFPEIRADNLLTMPVGDQWRAEAGNSGSEI
jgi:hypothetical protein